MKNLKRFSLLLLAVVMLLQVTVGGVTPSLLAVTGYAAEQGDEVTESSVLDKFSFVKYDEDTREPLRNITFRYRVFGNTPYTDVTVKSDVSGRVAFPDSLHNMEKFAQQGYIRITEITSQVGYHVSEEQHYIYHSQYWELDNNGQLVEVDNDSGEWTTTLVEAEDGYSWNSLNGADVIESVEKPTNVWRPADTTVGDEVEGDENQQDGPPATSGKEILETPNEDNSAISTVDVGPTTSFTATVSFENLATTDKRDFYLQLFQSGLPYGKPERVTVVERKGHYESCDYLQNANPCNCGGILYEINPFTWENLPIWHNKDNREYFTYYVRMIDPKIDLSDDGSVTEDYLLDVQHGMYAAGPYYSDIYRTESSGDFVYSAEYDKVQSYLTSVVSEDYADIVNSYKFSHPYLSSGPDIYLSVKSRKSSGRILTEFNLNKHYNSKPWWDEKVVSEDDSPSRLSVSYISWDYDKVQSSDYDVDFALSQSINITVPCADFTAVKEWNSEKGDEEALLLLMQGNTPYTGSANPIRVKASEKKLLFCAEDCQECEPSMYGVINGTLPYSTPCSGNCKYCGEYGKYAASATWEDLPLWEGKNKFYTYWVKELPSSWKEEDGIGDIDFSIMGVMDARSEILNSGDGQIYNVDYTDVWAYAGCQWVDGMTIMYTTVPVWYKIIYNDASILGSESPVYYGPEPYLMVGLNYGQQNGCVYNPDLCPFLGDGVIAPKGNRALFSVGEYDVIYGGSTHDKEEISPGKYPVQCYYQTITNTPIETIPFTATKIWEDPENVLGDTAYLQLFQSGKPYGTYKEVKRGENNQGEVTWENLPKWVDEETKEQYYTYYVREVVPEEDYVDGVLSESALSVVRHGIGTTYARDIYNGYEYFTTYGYTCGIYDTSILPDGIEYTINNDMLGTYGFFHGGYTPKYRWIEREINEDYGTRDRTNLRFSGHDASKEYWVDGIEDITSRAATAIVLYADGFHEELGNRTGDAEFLGLAQIITNTIYTTQFEATKEWDDDLGSLGNSAYLMLIRSGEQYGEIKQVTRDNAKAVWEGLPQWKSENDFYTYHVVELPLDWNPGDSIDPAWLVTSFETLGKHEEKFSDHTVEYSDVTAHTEHVMHDGLQTDYSKISWKPVDFTQYEEGTVYFGLSPWFSTVMLNYDYIFYGDTEFVHGVYNPSLRPYLGEGIERPAEGLHLTYQYWSELRGTVSEIYTLPHQFIAERLTQTVTNIAKEPTTSFELTKTWDDAGLSGDTAKFVLMQGGCVYGDGKVIELKRNSTNIATYTWKELPVYAEDGSAVYLYYVVEIPSSWDKDTITTEDVYTLAGSVICDSDVQIGNEPSTVYSYTHKGVPYNVETSMPQTLFEYTFSGFASDEEAEEYFATLLSEVIVLDTIMEEDGTLTYKCALTSERCWPIVNEIFDNSDGSFAGLAPGRKNGLAIYWDMPDAPQTYSGNIEVPDDYVDLPMLRYRQHITNSVDTIDFTATKVWDDTNGDLPDTVNLLLMQDSKPYGDGVPKQATRRQENNVGFPTNDALVTWEGLPVWKSENVYWSYYVIEMPYDWPAGKAVTVADLPEWVPVGDEQMSAYTVEDITDGGYSYTMKYSTVCASRGKSYYTWDDWDLEEYNEYGKYSEYYREPTCSWVKPEDDKEYCPMYYMPHWIYGEYKSSSSGSGYLGPCVREVEDADMWGSSVYAVFRYYANTSKKVYPSYVTTEAVDAGIIPLGGVVEETPVKATMLMQTITNIANKRTTSFELTKVWEDEGFTDGVTKFVLMQSGKLYDGEVVTLTRNGQNEAQHVWKGLPIFSGSGKYYVYYALELPYNWPDDKKVTQEDIASLPCAKENDQEMQSFTGQSRRRYDYKWTNGEHMYVYYDKIESVLSDFPVMWYENELSMKEAVAAFPEFIEVVSVSGDDTDGWEVYVQGVFSGCYPDLLAEYTDTGDFACITQLGNMEAYWDTGISPTIIDGVTATANDHATYRQRVTNALDIADIEVIKVWYDTNRSLGDHVWVQATCNGELFGDPIKLTRGEYPEDIKADSLAQAYGVTPEDIAVCYIRVPHKYYGTLKYGVYELPPTYTEGTIVSVEDLPVALREQKTNGYKYSEGFILEDGTKQNVENLGIDLSGKDGTILVARIYNTEVAQYALPNTGGMGLMSLYLLGGALLLSGLGIIYWVHKKRTI